MLTRSRSIISCKMLLAGLSILFSLGSAQAGGAAPAEAQHPPRKELIVRFKQGGLAADRFRALKHAASVEPLSPELKRQGASGAVLSGGMHRVQLPPEISVSEELARLSRNPAVAYVEPNYPIKIEKTIDPVIPNDLEFSQMYALRNRGENGGKLHADIKATEAWSFGTGSPEILVAVIDTGIDYFHQDLAPNIWRNLREIPGNGVDDDGNGLVDDVYGYDFVSDDSDPFDDNGHGTHVAGTIGAVGNNGVGTVGVCWTVSMMAIKAFDESGNGTVADAIAAIQYAVANGARLINASWGLQEKSRALEEAVLGAIEEGVLFVAAAGNSRSDIPSYPAAYEPVISVGATDEKDGRAIYSNFGLTVDIAAPGDKIFSTLPENSYGMQSGTSMATPHVVGTAALVLARFPHYTREELRDIIVNSIDQMLFDLPLGNGRLNASKAIQMDQPLPQARLTLPKVISGEVEVVGSGYGRFFTGYSLRVGSSDRPSQTNWLTVHSSAGMVTNSVLATFNSSALPDGNVVMQLIVTNANGSTAWASATTRILNTALTSPLSADILQPGVLEVRGTVHFPESTFTLLFGAGLKPTVWHEFASGNGAGQVDDFLAQWDTRNLTNNFYSLRLVVNNSRGKTEFEAPAIWIDSRLHPGWPVYLPIDDEFPNNEWRYARMADLDGDGRSEVVLVEPSTRHRPQRLAVYSASGLLLWSQTLGFDLAPDLPAIGDMNADGTMEIFVDVPTGIAAFKHDGTPLSPGWPVTNKAENHAKVLADLEGDGRLELIAFSQEYTAEQVHEERVLSVYNAEGSRIAQWFLPWCGFTNELHKIHPLALNLDEDPDLEIVTVSGCNQLAAYKVGQEQPLWRTFTEGALVSSPVAGDLDNDGIPEIIAAAGKINYFTSGGIYAFNRNGSIRPGWPVLSHYSFLNSPALGDLNKDGRLEMALASADPAELHLVESDGFNADGWPINPFGDLGPRCGVALADADGDGFSDLILSAPGSMSLAVNLGRTNNVGGLRAYRYSGQQLPINGPASQSTIPLEGSGSTRWFKFAPPSVGDLDGDGMLDLLLSSISDRTYGTYAKFKDRSSVYAWKLNGARADQPQEWPMLNRNPRNSGVYDLPLVVPPPPTNVTVAIRDRVLCAEDTPAIISPLANDLNSSPSPLEIASFTKPAHGSIQPGDSHTLVYTPSENFSGTDTFSYTIRDAFGVESSAPVKIVVNPLNDPPEVDHLDYTMNKNAAVDIVYSSRDADGDKVNYRIVVPPVNGELWNYPALGTYYPRKGFFGIETFVYVANDGRADSAPATVTVTVLNSNNPPTLVEQSFLVKSNRSLVITPNAKDIDGDPITFEISREPEHGKATFDGRKIRYVPVLDYLGPDKIGFRAFDGTEWSREGYFNISVISTNTAPVATSSKVQVQPNTTTLISLGGSDKDGDPIEFVIVTPPLHGSLQGTPPQLEYTPPANYEGPDRLTFKVTDGEEESAHATLDIRVLRENRPPVAEDTQMAASSDLPVPVPLRLTDADGDPLRTVILKGPALGTVYGLGTNLFYLWRGGKIGADQFTFKAWDGQKFGNIATVFVNVASPPPHRAPTINSLRLEEDTVVLSLSIRMLKPFVVEWSTDLRRWEPASDPIVPEFEVIEFRHTHPPAELPEKGTRYYRLFHLP